MTPVGSPGMTRRAVTVTGRRSVELLPAPPLDVPLGPDQVEGPTLASLVSPGTEINWYYDPVADPPGGYPAIPGYAAVFQVERVGESVTGLAPGDQALAFYGGHASHQRQSAARVARVDPGLAPEVAVFARIMAVSMATLSTTRARPPAGVGVSGLGLVGQLAARVFAAAGHRVVAWDRSLARRERLSGPGITVSDGPGVDLDLVLECTGHETAVLEACRAVRRGGEVSLVGVPWRARSGMLAQELLDAVFLGIVDLRSGWEYRIPDQPTGGPGGSTLENLAGAFRWLADGRVDVTGLAAVAAPAQAPEVYARLHARTWPALSAVFAWRQA